MEASRVDGLMLLVSELQTKDVARTEEMQNLEKELAGVNQKYSQVTRANDILNAMLNDSKNSNQDLLKNLGNEEQNSAQIFQKLIEETSR